MKEILGPILEQYRPPGISSLKLDQFHIGKVPPLIDGKLLNGATSVLPEVSSMKFWVLAK